MPPHLPPGPIEKSPTGWVRLRGSFSQTGRTLALVWKSSRGGTLALAALTVFAATIAPTIAYIGKIIVDVVVGALAVAPGARRDAALAGDLPGLGGGHGVVFWVAAELALVVAGALVERTLGLVRTLLGYRLGIDVNVMILEKALTLELRHFENPDFYDKLTRARREASVRPLSLVQENFQILRNTLTLGGYVVFLSGLGTWTVLALLAATIPAFVAETRFSGAAFRMRNWRSPEARRLSYLEYVLANDEHAKEVKLFGLGPLLLARYRVLAEQFFRQDARLAVRRAGWGYGLSLLSTVAFYVCYAAIAVGTVRGRLSLGDMTLYVIAFRQGQQAFQSILGAVGGMYEDNLYMSNLFDYLAIAPTVMVAPVSAQGQLTDDSAAPGFEGIRFEGIRFEGVGFRYQDSETWALRDINIAIPKGQSLALVGANGAGKTTFIKLLTRLYQPTEGRITLDGRDLRDWDEGTLRRRVGVIFQDFNQYQFLLRENIGVGSVEHLEDSARVGRAVERGGAREFVDGLAQGLETQLGRWFKEGVELSGGQWQKVALARAFMREEADILVLDEPTAALDAEAEHAVFQRFRTLAAGRTTILISHRFPTVRMADRILVVEKGRVIEQGTHAQLLAAGARYAQLFALQAEGYL